MSETVDFNAKKKERDRCVYCGGEGHKVPLACPRIESIEIDTDTGCVCGIRFWPDDDEPPVAG